MHIFQHRCTFKIFAFFSFFILNKPSEGKSEAEYYGRAGNNILASTANLSQQLHGICQEQREGARVFHQHERFQAVTTALKSSPYNHPFYTKTERCTCMKSFTSFVWLRKSEVAAAWAEVQLEDCTLLLESATS